MSRSICLAAAALILSSAPVNLMAQDKLKGVVGHHIEQVESYLNKTDKALARKDMREAKMLLGEAEKHWKTFQEWNAGKYDPKHPQVVAAEKRIEELRKKIAEDSRDNDQSAAEDSAEKQDSAGGQEKLTGVVGHHLEKVDRLLAGVEESLARHDVKMAAMTWGEAEQEWKAFREWNAGKYDPKHPQVAAVAKRFDMLGAKVKQETETTESQGESLEAIMRIIAENESRLKAANDESRDLLRNYESTKSDFDMGQADLAKLREKMEALRTVVQRFNDLLAPARAIAADFQKQFPDPQELSQKFGIEGRQAAQAAERVGNSPDLWLEELKRHVEDAFETATSNISEAESALASAADQPEIRQNVITDSAEKWALGFADLLLELPGVAFPELPDEAKKSVPEFVKARQEYLARVEPLRKRIDAIAVQVGKLRKDVVDAERRRIAAARFPKSEYTGGKWDEAEKDIRAVWAGEIPDKELLKVSISSPWDERTEARWRNDHWIIGTYRYITANCLAKLADGKHMVYRMTFRNTKRNGEWSELAHWGVGRVYEMLPENADE